MDELAFEITEEADGDFTAECLTEGDNWEELRNNVREAVAAFYFDRPDPSSAIRLHLVRDEVLATR